MLTSDSFHRAADDHKLSTYTAAAHCVRLYFTARLPVVPPKSLSALPWWLTRSCSGLEAAAAPSWSFPSRHRKQPLLSVSERMMKMMRSPQSKATLCQTPPDLGRAQTERPSFLSLERVTTRLWRELSTVPRENMHKSRGGSRSAALQELWISPKCWFKWT